MNKIHIALAVAAISLASGVASAQSRPTLKAQKTIERQEQQRPAVEPVLVSDDKAVVEERVCQAVEQRGSFPGGEAALYEWLKNTLKYPEQAWVNGVQGRVIVSFVIEKDGRVTNPKVVRGVSPELDAEALRVVGAMPKWTPGKNNGVAVRSRYDLPITFKMPPEPKEQIEE